MLFAAGIGATLLYWSTIEWFEYYNILSLDDNYDRSESLIYSRTYPVFHWGPTAWSIYCLPVVAFALALSNKSCPIGMCCYSSNSIPVLDLGTTCGWLRRSLTLIIHFMRRYNNTMAMFRATIRITPPMIQRYHYKYFGNNSLTISFP